MVAQEVANVFAQVLFGDGRDLRGQLDLEAVSADIPAHHVFGVGVEPAAGGQHLGSGGCAGSPFGDDGGRAVTKQAGGHQIGDGVVVTLQRQRAQFDGEQHRHVIGEREQVVMHAGHPGGAGDTAEAE